MANDKEPITASDQDDDPGSQETATPKSMADFLESSPPNHYSEIGDLASRDSRINEYSLARPPIQLYCSNGSCSGVRFFSCLAGSFQLKSKTPQNFFLRYVCRNCQRMIKTYAISVTLDENRRGGKALKFGEWPAFGPPTPSRVIKLIGPDRELFLMGRRAENQGMGIGAFVYYRRVVENQKNRILGEIIRAAKKLQASEELLRQLESAREERQFSKAIESIKQAIPQALLIDGHSPLTLLYSALSEGVHEHTDDECLELATSVRAVLVELAERVGQTLKDEVELNAAVSHLLEIASKRGMA